MRYDIDTYHELARPFFAVKLLTPPNDFRADVIFRNHGGLVGCKVALSNQRLSRNPRGISDFDTEFLLIEFYRRGYCRGVVGAGEAPTFVDRNTIHIVDWSRDYRAVMGDMEGIGLQVPHGLVGYDPSRHPAYLSFPLRTARGRLLSLSVELLVEAMGKSPPDEVEALASATLGLLRTLVLGDTEWENDPSNVCARRGVIESYIRRRITRADLTPVSICRDIGMSRATLYRAFGEGGVERFIRSERLLHCFSDLLQAEKARGTVNRVARRWGFYDPSNFRRSFRAAFGVAPSDCIGDRQLRPRPRGVPHPVHDWMRERSAPVPPKQ